MFEDQKVGISIGLKNDYGSYKREPGFFPALSKGKGLWQTICQGVDSKNLKDKLFKEGEDHKLDSKYKHKIILKRL